MNENLINIYNELNALYNCYIVLKESSLENDISIVGMMTLYEKMAEILRQRDVFELLTKDNSYVLEDYIHHVKEDTPEFLSKIKGACVNNHTKLTTT